MTQINAAGLSLAEITRYRRQLLLPEVGLAGQERLKAARVLCVGAGGLGSPAALYLAAAGVGTLGIVDSDAVDLTNLQRQILYSVADIGSPKVESARRRIAALNPEIRVVAHECELSADNAVEILSGFDVVVDGSDNFTTRYLVSDTCARLGKPDVWAAIYQFEGQLSVFDARTGPCYRCLFPEPPEASLAPSCAEGGVLGVLPGVVGALQASEVLKIVLGVGAPLLGRLLVFDALAGTFAEVAVAKQPTCPGCGPGAAGASLAPGTKPAPVAIPAPAGSPLSGLEAMPSDSLSCEALEALRAGGGHLTLIDCREPGEWEICHLEGSVLVPMRTLVSRLAEFDRESEIIVICHHGPRSELVAELLRDKGFGKVRWLEGGLAAWAERIDPEMARY